MENFVLPDEAFCSNSAEVFLGCQIARFGSLNMANIKNIIFSEWGTATKNCTRVKVLLLKNNNYLSRAKLTIYCLTNQSKTNVIKQT